MNRKIFTLSIFILFFLPSAHVASQSLDAPSGPIYIVQNGDTLWDIAQIFHVDVNELVKYNSIVGFDIYIGDQLVIPGYDELTGTFSILSVEFGETLRSISRQYKILPLTLLNLNHIVSPAELFAGSRILLLQDNNSAYPISRDTLSPSESILEFAAQQNTQTWLISRLNNLEYPTSIVPGDVMSLFWGTARSAPAGFPSSITYVNIDPLPISQGDTTQISLRHEAEATISGSLGVTKLNFFSISDELSIAFQGIHAMMDPGIYPVRITVTDSSKITQSFEQMILIQNKQFPTELLYVDVSLIDPDITETENEWLLSITSSISSEKLWTGIFHLPVATDTYCLRSGFGNRRNYNEGELYSFHTGLDFGICSESRPFDIYAPANGKVIYIGNKPVRGNVTIIDHGWGIFSGFWHQKDIFLNPGETVEMGQLIGTIGDTGRVTGPHLHWELWVNGTQVDPFEWLEQEFPHD